MDAGDPGDGDALLLEDVPASGAIELERAQKLALAQWTVDGHENRAAGVGVVDADAGHELGCARGAEVDALVADPVVAIERSDGRRVPGDAAALHVEGFGLNGVEGRARAGRDGCWGGRGRRGWR